jgi:hypothetical protein
VIAGNVSGAVFVDGQNMGTLTDGRTELTVPIGQHEVRVVAEGYNDAVGTVMVRPGASNEITLNPTPKQGAAAGPASGGPAETTPKDTGPKTSTQKIIGYAGIGVGGAIALVGGYFWLQTMLNSDDDALVAFKAERDSSGNPVVGKGEDACDVAEEEGRQDIVDLCDKHSTQRTLAWVLTPIGLAIAGAGAYFLLTDDSGSRKEQTRTRVMPLVGLGPKGGSVQLRVAF